MFGMKPVDIQYEEAQCQKQHVEESKQLSLVPIEAWLLSLHTSLKMFPLSLTDICTNLLRS